MWPSVFEVNDLAKLIVSLVPWLQYLQWITECDCNTLQTQLCNWYAGCYAHEGGKAAIVAQKNIQALGLALPMFGERDWQILATETNISMFEYALKHAKQKPFYLCGHAVSNVISHAIAVGDELCCA